MNYIFLFLLMVGIAESSHAQSSASAFTGSLTVVAYNLDAEGNPVRMQQVPLLVSPNRVRVLGLSRVDPSAITTNLGAEDLLIRLDSEDFVFLLQDNQALSVQKNELQALLMLAAGMQPPQQTTGQSSPEMQARQTSETRQIHGYTARKWVLTKPGTTEESHVWVSSAFGLNLGMLSESWISSLPGIRILPYNTLIEGGRTPLLVETFRGGRKVAVVELRDFNTNINTAQLEIPSQTKVMTLQEMMLNRMRNY